MNTTYTDKKTIVVGIDLGTTYSSIAYVDDTGRPTIIPNRDGENSTPSVLFFEGKNVVVGSMAQESALREPRQTARLIKRYMGLPGARFIFSNQIMDPEILSAFILKKLIQDAERRLGQEPGGIRDAVITVPAYFTDIQRKATADSGRIAGINVLSIINEPVAAALFYSLDRLQSNVTILVYDLGGGTFDLTLLRIQNGIVRMIATDGTARLGGYDWTLTLANLVCDQFVRQYNTDPREDLDSLQYVMNNTEKAKRILSVKDRVVITITHAGHTMKIPVTREEFESCTAHLLEQTSSIIKLCFQRKKIPFSGVDRIILVGGTTRMPMILKLIQRYFPDCSLEQINPDDCVALGAAVYANMHSRDMAKHKPSGEAIPVFSQIRAEMICPHSLGVEAVQKDERRVNAILIPRETPIPSERSRTFFTSKDGQTSVKINILEGETEDPEGCVSVGCCIIEGLPPAPRKENEIEVTFHYNDQGRIQISAIHKRTGKTASTHIERNAGIPDKSLDDAIGNFNEFKVE
jgi:molecular chaperone DnaK